MRDAWLDDVAAYILEAHKSAVGGLLVLGIAFADLVDLERKLSAHGLPLIVQRPGVRMEGLRTQFLARAKSPGRFCWRLARPGRDLTFTTQTTPTRSPTW